MNKNLLVLGASSDIGLAVISQLFSDYDRIIAHYNNSVIELLKLKSVVGEKLALVKADFSSETDTDAFIEHVANNFEAPTHILHLPAGRVKNINFHKSDWSRVEFDIHISLRSIYKIINRFIKPMTKNKYGKIVFMLTSYTFTTPKFMLDYTTVKYALLGFMKSLATEYADKGININAVSPSMIETKFLRDVPSLIVEQSAESNPLKRNATTDDIVPAIKFLLSDESAYIIGQNILIAGGSVI